MKRLLPIAVLLLLTLSSAFAACVDGDGGTSSPNPPSPTRVTNRGDPTATAGLTPAGEPAITISSPDAGAEVPVPVVISGTANVFEAVLFVQLLDEAERVLCESRVMATSGTGTEGTWDTAIAFVPPQAPAPATIRAFSRSARDGSDENIVTRGIRVAATQPNIVIAEPACNQDFAAGGQMFVSGLGRVFEGTLTVELRDAFGGPVRSETTTTLGGEVGAFGAYQVNFDLGGLPAGAYDVVAYSISAEDGSAENIFTVPVRITV